jgi:hypothetical protein
MILFELFGILNVVNFFYLFYNINKNTIIELLFLFSWYINGNSYFFFNLITTGLILFLYFYSDIKKNYVEIKENIIMTNAIYAKREKPKEILMINKLFNFVDYYVCKINKYDYQIYLDKINMISGKIYENYLVFFDYIKELNISNFDKLVNKYNYYYDIYNKINIFTELTENKDIKPENMNEEIMKLMTTFGLKTNTQNNLPSLTPSQPPPAVQKPKTNSQQQQTNTNTNNTNNNAKINNTVTNNPLLNNQLLNNQLLNNQLLNNQLLNNPMLNNVLTTNISQDLAKIFGGMGMGDMDMNMNSEETNLFNSLIENMSKLTAKPQSASVAKTKNGKIKNKKRR